MLWIKEIRYTGVDSYLEYQVEIPKVGNYGDKDP